MYLMYRRYASTTGRRSKKVVHPSQPYPIAHDFSFSLSDLLFQASAMLETAVYFCSRFLLSDYYTEYTLVERPGWLPRTAAGILVIIILISHVQYCRNSARAPWWTTARSREARLCHCTGCKLRAAALLWGLSCGPMLAAPVLYGSIIQATCMHTQVR